MKAVRAAVSRAALRAVRERAPDGVEVIEITPDADLSRVSFLVPRAGDRTVIELLPKLDALEVLQTMSAGVDWIEAHVPEGVVLCSARGARDAPVAEWILGALLGASSGLLRHARDRRWDRQPLQDLATWTVLVVGMGSIGRMVQQRLEPLGTTVRGVGSRRHDDLHGPEELGALLADADAVVVLTPLSDATRGQLGAAELARLRDGALVVNAARGPVIDSGALLAELRSGRLRAVLDVTDPEPLPEDHPLWDAAGTLAITPHIAGDSALGHERAAVLAGEQLARWCRGEELVNVVRRGPASGA